MYTSSNINIHERYHVPNRGISPVKTAILLWEFVSRTEEVFSNNYRFLNLHRDNQSKHFSQWCIPPLPPPQPHTPPYSSNNFSLNPDYSYIIFVRPPSMFLIYSKWLIQISMKGSTPMPVGRGSYSFIEIFTYVNHQTPLRIYHLFLLIIFFVLIIHIITLDIGDFVFFLDFGTFPSTGYSGTIISSITILMDPLFPFIINICFPSNPTGCYYWDHHSSFTLKKWSNL